jgi:nucleotide-binding universal stress UspA family protein
MSETTAMFKRIAVAYNESSEAGRALASAIHLAKVFGANLQAVTIVQKLPAYTAYVTAVDASLTRTLVTDQRSVYDKLHSEAREAARREGVDLVSHLLEGDEVDALVSFLVQYKADLLVIGLHSHMLHISRLWSTVYEVAQDAPCSVLGVH